MSDISPCLCWPLWLVFDQLAGCLVQSPKGGRRCLMSPPVCVVCVGLCDLVFDQPAVSGAIPEGRLVISDVPPWTDRVTLPSLQSMLGVLVFYALLIRSCVLFIRHAAVWQTNTVEPVCLRPP